MSPLQTSTAFLSTRLSIAWLPSPPSQLEDVLVLTGTKYYVDVRIANHDRSLSWGMAGVKTIVGGTKDKPVARFSNILDSHLPRSSLSQPPAASETEAALPDEGEFTLLPNGLTLEAGTMVNPATGLPQAYEEIWQPVPVETGERVLILERVVEGEGGKGLKAFVGICGGWALSVYETEKGYGGWKGRRKEGEGGGWGCVWKSKEGGKEADGWDGDEGVEEWSEEWREGHVVEWKGAEWKVLEHSFMGEGRPK